jgi:hypothetical protein
VGVKLKKKVKNDIMGLNTHALCVGKRSQKATKNSSLLRWLFGINPLTGTCLKPRGHLKAEEFFMGTSKLQETTASLLHQHFGRFEIKENYRPDWLTNGEGNRIELDFYLPELNIAIEVNGNQHYHYNPFFHNEYSDFEKQKRHDDIKKAVCQRKKITLIELTSYYELLDAIEDIKTTLSNNLPYDEYIRLKVLFFDKRLGKYEKQLRGGKARKNKTKRMLNERKKQVKGLRRKLRKERKKAQEDFREIINILSQTV